MEKCWKRIPITLVWNHSHHAAAMGKVVAHLGGDERRITCLYICKPSPPSIQKGACTHVKMQHLGSDVLGEGHSASGTRRSWLAFDSQAI